MKIFVLGGSGSVGRAFAKIASKELGEVVLVDLRKSDDEEFRSISADCLKPAEIGQLILLEKPDIIINAINMATIFSKVPAEGNKKSILFHLGLYDTLSKMGKKVSYLQVGTLGTGGLGFNVPFTHGEAQDDLPLFHKAALSGVTTSMLVLLSRSLPNCQISEIKPGLSIFNTDVTATSYEGCSLVLLNGGENGHYTYNELALLTSFMGFTTPDRIASEMMAILRGETSDDTKISRDVVKSVNESVIAESEADSKLKASLLAGMRSKQTNDFIIASGDLGPPSLTRDLILAALIKSEDCSDETQFNQAVRGNTSVTATLKYIGETNPACAEYLSKEVNYQNYLALKHFATAGELWEIVCSALKGTTSDLS